MVGGSALVSLVVESRPVEFRVFATRLPPTPSLPGIKQSELEKEREKFRTLADEKDQRIMHLTAEFEDAQARQYSCCCGLLLRVVVAGCCCGLLLRVVVAGCCCGLLLWVVVVGCCCGLLLWVVVGCCGLWVVVVLGCGLLLRVVVRVCLSPPPLSLPLSLLGSRGRMHWRRLRKRWRRRTNG